MWRNPTRSRTWLAPDILIDGIVLQIYAQGDVFKVDAFPYGKWTPDSKKFYDIHEAFAHHEKLRRRFAVRMAINNLVTV